MADWQKLSSKIVYENRWLIVYEDQVITPAGNESIYGYMRYRCDVVYVVAIDAHQNTFLTLQQRYPTGKTNWECPAGFIENETVESAAKRELLEETGMQADSIKIMSTVDIANGVAAIKNNVCLAKDLKKVTTKLDPVDGIIATKKVPLAKVYDMIINGEIVCSQSIAAFYMAGKYLESKDKEQ